LNSDLRGSMGDGLWLFLQVRPAFLTLPIPAGRGEIGPIPRILMTS
jgi:hypothetical protein